MSNLTDQERIAIRAIRKDKQLRSGTPGVTLLTQPEGMAKRQFDPAARVVGAQLRRDLDQIANQAVKEYLASQGHMANVFNITTAVTVRPKGKRGSSKAIDSLLDVLLTEEGAKKSQAAIRSVVAAKHPDQYVYKDWTVVLHPWARKKIQQRLEGYGPPLRDVRLPAKLTLALLRTLIQKAFAPEARYSLKVEVRIAASQVFIDDQPFKISQNKVKGVSYPSIRISIDKLRSLVE